MSIENDPRYKPDEDKVLPFDPDDRLRYQRATPPTRDWPLRLAIAMILLATAAIIWAIAAVTSSP